MPVLDWAEPIPDFFIRFISAGLVPLEATYEETWRVFPAAVKEMLLE